jgi:hypothetical protein
MERMFYGQKIQRSGMRSELFVGKKCRLLVDRLMKEVD